VASIIERIDSGCTGKQQSDAISHSSDSTHPSNPEAIKATVIRLRAVNMRLDQGLQGERD
jgi:hypothetical protein